MANYWLKRRACRFEIERLADEAFCICNGGIEKDQLEIVNYVISEYENNAEFYHYIGMPDVSDTFCILRLELGRRLEE
jgi:hypothetical protein